MVRAASGLSGTSSGGLRNPEHDEYAARHNEMLAAKREESIQRREQKRRDRDAIEAKERARAAEVQRKRDANIEHIEVEWLQQQEQQRAKDDAMVQFIRTARERRAAERELERQEMEEKAMLEEKLKRYMEVERKREANIQAREKSMHSNNDIKSTQDRITQQRLAELNRLRRMNERRIEDEINAKEESLKIAERDRVLIREARHRRLTERETQRQLEVGEREQAEQEQHKLEIVRRREENIKRREQALAREQEQRRAREASIIKDAREMRMQTREWEAKTEQASAELQERTEALERRQVRVEGFMAAGGGAGSPTRR